jgi:chemotaxis protein histidine kinase CheA
MVPQEVEPSQKSFFVFLESDSETAIETAFGVLSPVSCEESKDETLAALFGATVLEIELLAESLGKKIDTTIISNNLEPDEKLRQGLATILIHLVRNSVDHGIADRGRIDIALFSEPGFVRLLVADDGRGIDLDELRRRAAKINANRALPDDIFELISTAGLSTSVAVTDISGRGVGLDVVREQIAALNGKISVENRKSKGVFFEIAIPVGPAETNE